MSPCRISRVLAQQIIDYFTTAVLDNQKEPAEDYDEVERKMEAMFGGGEDNNRVPGGDNDEATEDEDDKRKRRNQIKESAESFMLSYSGKSLHLKMKSPLCQSQTE